MSDELCCGYSDKGHMKWCDEGCDRHPKWQPVEPGTPVEAGRTYRVEYPSPLDGWKKAVESQAPPEGYTIPSHGAWLTYEWFVDSSWKPPLVLPTEPGSVIRARYDGDDGKGFEGLFMRRPTGDYMPWLCDYGTYYSSSLTVLEVLFDADAPPQSADALAEAWREGWIAMGQEHMKQRNNPRHPIGEGVVNPYENEYTA